MERIGGRKRVWSIAGVVAVAGLAVATIAPPSGWIVRQQLVWTAAMLLPKTGVAALAPSMGSMDKAREATAARHPDDLGMQIAYVGMNPDKLMALQSRFPNRPALDAALLIALSKDRLNLDNREADQEQLQWPNPITERNDAFKAPTPETLATWDAAAQDGEGCDPDNAFFPMMRAVGLFAAGRDDEACDAFRRASALPRYDDYQSATTRGGWRLAEAAQGMKSNTLSRTAIRAAVLFPEFQPLRASARLAVVHAIDLEKSGKSEEGFAVRRAVARTGDRMRTDSPWLIGNLCGAAISAITRHRPGGAPEFPLQKNNAAARAAKIKQAYETYLRQIGHGDEISRIEYEDSAIASIKSITRQGLDSGPGSLQSILLLSALWAAGAFVLTSALLILVLGGACALVSRTATVRAARRPHFYTRVGVVCLVIGVFFYLAEATFGLFGVANGGVSLSSADDSAPANFARLLSALLLCAAPIAMTITIAIRSRRENIPASTGIVRGFVRAALPTATTLLFVFVALIALLSAGEACGLRDIDALNGNEGKTFAIDQHKAWPSFAPSEK